MRRIRLTAAILASIVIHVFILFLSFGVQSDATQNKKANQSYAPAYYRLAHPNRTAALKNTTEIQNYQRTYQSASKASQPGNSTASITDKIGLFESERLRLIEKLEESKTYPYAARKPGKEIQGSVGIVTIFDPAGNLVSCEIAKSSGSSILDWAAVDLVKKISPFKHSLQTQFVCSFSIGYWLEN